MRSSIVASTYTYTGEEPKAFTYYRDLTDPEHPKTLEAEPGETYAIEPAAGHMVPSEPDEHGHSELVPLEVPMPPSEEFVKAAQAKKNEKKGDD
jgi:hypothetical protein